MLPVVSDTSPLSRTVAGIGEVIDKYLRNEKIDGWLLNGTKIALLDMREVFSLIKTVPGEVSLWNNMV